MRPHLEKKPSRKKAGGVTQVLRMPVTKCKALSSNPSATKKKIKIHSFKVYNLKPVIVVQACNPSPWEVKVEGSPLPGQGMGVVLSGRALA
jgi:hypothetical protein